MRNAAVAGALHHRQLPRRLYAGYSLDGWRLWLLPVVHAWRDVCRSAFHAARQALPNLDASIGAGDLRALFDWLRQSVWQHGSRFTTSQLMINATGDDLNPRYFRDHLTARYL